jgi:hypothetical protein
MLDAQQVPDAIREPHRAPPGSPLHPDVIGPKPRIKQVRRLSGEPGRVGMHALMNGQADTIGNVSRPQKLNRAHRSTDIQVLCRWNPTRPQTLAAASESETAA